MDLSCVGLIFLAVVAFDDFPAPLVFPSAVTPCEASQHCLKHPSLDQRLLCVINCYVFTVHMKYYTVT